MFCVHNTSLEAARMLDYKMEKLTDVTKLRFLRII